MSNQSYTTRIERLRAEVLNAHRRSWAYVVGVFPVAMLLAMRLVGPRAAFIAAAAAVAGAAFWRITASRAASARREILDELILNDWKNVAPGDVAERVEELLAPRNRRVLARALENQVQHAPLMLTIAQGSLTAELRRNRAGICQLARRLRSRERVDPRGVVMVEQLIRDGGSPLHSGPTGRIAHAIEQADRMLDAA
jgi:hypothetical protein